MLPEYLAYNIEGTSEIESLLHDIEELMLLVAAAENDIMDV